jgi:hypothetical protein
MRRVHVCTEKTDRHIDRQRNRETRTQQQTDKHTDRQTGRHIRTGGQERQRKRERERGCAPHTYVSCVPVYLPTMVMRTSLSNSASVRANLVQRGSDSGTMRLILSTCTHTYTHIRTHTRTPGIVFVLFASMHVAA